MKISIIIPCYNEVSTIEILLKKILKEKKFKKEIIDYKRISSILKREKY